MNPKNNSSTDPAAKSFTARLSISFYPFAQKGGDSPVLIETVYFFTE
jgi:hypothetical protein